MIENANDGSKLLSRVCDGILAELLCRIFEKRENIMNWLTIKIGHSKNKVYITA